jgi:hypothetical protein
MPACFTNVLLEKIRTCFSLSYDCEDIVSGTAQRLKQTQRCAGSEPRMMAPLNRYRDVGQALENVLKSKKLDVTSEGRVESLSSGR